MINPDLICPECNQYGYVAPPATGDMRSLLGAICHCCGHVADENEIARRQKEIAAPAKALRR
jgi:hypothetical protein